MKQIDCENHIVPTMVVLKRWLASAVDLKGFMCRVEVLKLYRMYIRTSRLARSDMRVSLMEEIRKEFASRKDISDVQTIKYLLSDGKTRLNQLRDMLQLSH